MFPYRRSTLIQNTVVTAMASNRYLLLFEDKINITIDTWNWWTRTAFSCSRWRTGRYEWIIGRWTANYENRNSESYYHKNALNSWSLFSSLHSFVRHVVHYWLRSFHDDERLRLFHENIHHFQLTVKFW